MNGTVGIAVSELRTGHIDWKARLARLDALRVDGWFVHAEVQVRREGYRQLYAVVEDCLRERSLATRTQELAALRVHLQGTELVGGVFAEEFSVFEHLAQVSLSEADEVLPTVDADMMARHGALLFFLLEDMLKTCKAEKLLEQPVSYRVLDRNLKLFKRLRRLYKEEVSSDLEVTHSFKAYFLQWIAVLVHGFSWLLNLSVAPDSDVYIKTAEHCVEILDWAKGKGFELSSIPLQALSNVLGQCYAKKAQVIGTKAYYFEQKTDEPGIDKLILKLDEDLSHIKAWGSARYKATSYETGEAQLEQLLTVYKETRAKLDKWSEAAFAFRMQLEERLRKPKKWFNFSSDFEADRGVYIAALSQLDEKLLALDTKRHQIQQDWLREAAQLAPVLKEATDVLAHLDAPCLARLREVHWLHTTCFSAARTEERFGFEMSCRKDEKRKRSPLKESVFKHYALNETYVMTDLLVDELSPEVFQQVTKLVRGAHPDKHLHMNKIATHCFQELANLQEQAARFRTTWWRCQHYKKTTNPEVLQLRQTIELDKEDLPVITMIEPPPALDLSVLRLHQRYLELLARSSTLEKEVFPTLYAYMCHQIFTGDDTDEARANFHMERRLYYILEKEKPELIAAIEEARRRRDAANARAEEARREKDVANARAEAERKEKDAANARAEEARKEKEDALKKILLKGLKKLIKPGLSAGEICSGVEEVIQDTCEIYERLTREKIVETAREVAKADGQLSSLLPYIPSAQPSQGRSASAVPVSGMPQAFFGAAAANATQGANVAQRTGLQGRR